jgi:hypothetical protein
MCFIPRTLTIAALGLCLAAAPLAAQARYIEAGPMVGFASTTITGDNQDDTKSRTGLMLGGFLAVRLGDRFVVQPEALHVQKGARFEDFGDATMRVNYLQIPLTVRARFPRAGGTFTPTLLAGPTLAMRLGCTIQFEGEDFDCDDTDSQVTGSDFGMVFGAGAEIGRVRVSLRYDQGLRNINAEGPAKVKNRALEATVGYAFRLGR